MRSLIAPVYLDVKYLDALLIYLDVEYLDVETRRIVMTLTIAPWETVTIRTSTPEQLELEATFLPHDGKPPAHWHPDQDEHFEILEGTLSVRLGDQQLRVSAGDTVDIPRGTVHQFWNAGTAPARAIWQVRPAGRTEQWFTAIDAVHRSGRVGKNGRPSPLAYAVFLTEYRDIFRLATPAAPLVRAALTVLAPIGRLRGYRPVVTPSA
jgi:mannose-6-phosphate isomerase-like protein (cupin superfamily)